MKGIVVQLSFMKESIEVFTVDDIPGQSIFMQLYGDILTDLDKLYWVCPDGAFSSNHALNENEMDYFYNSLTLETGEIYEPYSIFPEHARWIRDDNNILLGFNKKPDSSLVKRIFESPCCETDFIENYVDVLFANQDASFWEMFAKDEGLINKSLRSVRRVVAEKYIALLNLSDRNRFYGFGKELGI